jgi:hypothetical protein
LAVLIFKFDFLGCKKKVPSPDRFGTFNDVALLGMEGVSPKYSKGMGRGGRLFDS